jgi:hypothetical protein
MVNRELKIYEEFYKSFENIEEENVPRKLDTISTEFI